MNKIVCARYSSDISSEDRHVQGCTHRSQEQLHLKKIYRCCSARIATPGFTLVEILIVMLIISIVASVAVLTITTNQNKNIENFTHQLVNIIKLSEEEAMLRPATLGLAFTSNTYQFYQFQKKWIALTDKIYGEHHFSRSIKLSLKVQNKVVPLDGKPHLIISTSGDISPFIILIGKQNHLPMFKIIGETNGNIKNEEYRPDEE